MKIKVDKSIFSYKSIEIMQGITCIIGTSGSGKSTLINEIYKNIDKRKVEVKLFNKEIGILNMVGLEYSPHINSSGLTALHGFSIWFSQKVRPTLEINRKPLVILIDDVDSGMSINCVVDISNFLFDSYNHIKRYRDVYIVIATNNYEMTINRPCIVAKTKDVLRFNNYVEFSNKIKLLGEIK